MKTPALNDNEIQQVLRIFRVNGTGPTVVRKVAQQYHIAESVADGLGKIITESAASLLTETGPANPERSVRESHQHYLAEKLATEVNRAESRASLADATGQELYAMAAAYIS